MNPPSPMPTAVPRGMAMFQNPRPLFRRKQSGEHGSAGGGVSGLADPDGAAGEQQLGEVSGEGAGDRRDGPEKGHDAHGLFPAPAVDDDRDGKDEGDDGPVEDRHAQARLHVREAPLVADEGRDGGHDRPIHVIEKVQKKQQREDVVRASGRQLSSLGGNGVGIHRNLLIRFRRG